MTEPNFYQEEDGLDTYGGALRFLYVRQIRNSALMLVVIALAWGTLSFFVPEGWWHAFFNIPIFLFTGASAVVIYQGLKALGNPGWLAWIMAIVIWAVAVFLMRSITIGVLESIL
ncbi:MAG: hypothetical protein H8E48_12140 [Chloroflexi bacterium]|nr:hypothetical protein [Chloroflexota bacterium]